MTCWSNWLQESCTPSWTNFKSLESFSLMYLDQYSSEEVTVSAQNSFVSIVMTCRCIIRIVFFNRSKTIPFTKTLRPENSFNFPIIMSFHVSNKVAYSMETSFTHYTMIFSLVFILLNHHSSLLIWCVPGGLMIILVLQLPASSHCYIT